ncbi:hypothetical protein N0V90_007962 [Kalmusia sp. IMI 367209]|nr:hypothetical protein N0V90_007962 [Kalmusia sp. IMI 367209]
MHPCVIQPVIPPELDEDASTPLDEDSDLSTLDDNETDDSCSTRSSESWNIIQFPKRPKQEDTKPYVFTVLPAFREWTYSMKGPIFSRGWTLQERELSVRVLHFTSDRVVWECRECYASEDDPTLKAKDMFFDVGLKFRLLDGSPKDRKNRPYNYKFSKWMDLVEEYSLRRLSIKEDKLRAIAGLAEAIKSVQQDDTYLSGIWKRDLATQLLWYAMPKPEHSVSSEFWPPAVVARGIPTWSWAAYDGAVAFDRPQGDETSVFSAKVQQANPSCIKISGTTFNVPLSEAECGSSETGAYHKYYKWPKTNPEYQIYITLDTDPGARRELGLLCLVLVQRSLHGEPSRSPPMYSSTSPGTNAQVSAFSLLVLVMSS